LKLELALEVDRLLERGRTHRRRWVRIETRSDDLDDIIIPEHAWEAMQADSITEDDVFTVVGDYDEVIERITDGRTEYSRMMDDGRWLVVVIEKDGETMVSAWWDRRRSRRQQRRR
jgi:hypothetical protein